MKSSLLMILRIKPGHVIFNTVTYDITKFLKISSTTILETINLPNGIPVEKRSIPIIFHALYTYYTTFICLMLV